MNEIKIEKLFPNNSNLITGKKENCLFNTTSSEKPSFLLRIKAKSFKKLNYLLASLVVAIITYMFNVKNEVQDLYFELRQMKAELVQAQNHYGLLKAELAYLNSPVRIQALADQYLKMEVVKPKQFVLNDKKSNHLGVGKFLELASKNSSKTWRYDKDSSNIHRASYEKKSNK